MLEFIVVFKTQVVCEYRFVLKLMTLSASLLLYTRSILKVLFLDFFNVCCMYVKCFLY